MSMTAWLLVAAAIATAPAHAETLPAAPAMTDQPCPPPQPGPPAAMMTMMLQPGAKPPAMTPTKGPDPALQDYIKKRTEGLLRDYADLCRYKPANAALTRAPRVVLMGDSITDNWLFGDPGLFSAAIVDRGIGGQTSPQMVVRFYQDVIALHPRIVHIMAGTNDVAGNTGPTSAEDYKNNIRAMVALARANGIGVILAAIPPASRFPWRPDLDPQPQIGTLNAWLRGYATEQGVAFVDYGRILAAPAGGMKPEFSNDGVHPNTRGYAVMHPLFVEAVELAEHGANRNHSGDVQR